MFLVLQLGAAALFASLILTPAVRALARRWKILDYPSERKIHLCPMPRVGGVAITVAYFFAFGAVLFAGRNEHAWLDRWVALGPFLAAITAIFVVGLVDDLHGLTHWQKLAGQFAASGIAYWAGIRVAGPGTGGSHWWSLPATIAWLLLCTNAVNLIDGVDGLAAGIGLLATATAFLAAILQGNFELALITAPLVGALLGFLRFNFNPATIFLGDSGSLFIGFLLGCYGVLWSEKSPSVLGAAAPLLALSVPLLDTVITIARRMARHQSIFVADRAHLHHRLLDRGLNPRRATLLLYAFCILGSAVSLLMTWKDYAGATIIPVLIVAWLGFRYFIHDKFHLPSGAFSAAPSRRRATGSASVTDFLPSRGTVRSRAGFTHNRVLGSNPDSRSFRVTAGSPSVNKTKI
jgi:UDP-GlcNAc:undecaprenyl-phosphate GlcNAc-1-phosphate transferase